MKSKYVAIFAILSLALFPSLAYADAGGGGTSGGTGGSTNSCGEDYDYICTGVNSHEPAWFYFSGVSHSYFPYRDAGSNVYFKTTHATDRDVDSITPVSKNSPKIYVFGVNFKNKRGFLNWDAWVKPFADGVVLADISYLRESGNPKMNPANGQIASDKYGNIPAVDSNPAFTQAGWFKRGTRYRYGIQCYTNPHMYLPTVGNCADILFLKDWKVTRTEYRKKITKLKFNSCENRSCSGEFDYSRNTPQWKFDHAPGSANYSRITGFNQFDYNGFVATQIENIGKTSTCDYDGTNLKNCTVRYTVNNIVPKSASFNYNVKMPSITQTWFRPLSLNNGGHATDSLVKSVYPSYSPTGDIEGSVDNRQGITDGSDLKTLNTNSSTPFKVALNNDQMGIPTKSEGGFDIVHANEYERCDESPVCSVNDIDRYGREGYINSYLRMNGSNAATASSVVSKPFNFGVSAITGVSSPDASITYGNDEKVGGNYFGFAPGWRGGDFVFKSIKVGKYYLSRDSRPFWEADYNRAKLFSYGIKFGGTVTISGFSTPYIQKNNLYVGYNVKNLKQPLVYGVFDVKTVGGSR